MVAAIVSHAARCAPNSIDALAARLKRYDDRLYNDISLAENNRFLMVVSAVSATLMPMLNTVLESAPERRNDREFVDAYNLCARYQSQPQLPVA